MKYGSLAPWWSSRDLPFASLQKEIDRVFDSYTRGMSDFAAPGWKAEAFAPRVDLVEEKEELKVTAELPGMDAKDVECTLDEDVLTIRGEKKSERTEEDKEKGHYLEERSYGSFCRAIPLPYAVDADKIQAAYSNGVLTVRLPKAPEAKSNGKRIAINSSDAGKARADKKVA